MLATAQADRSQPCAADLLTKVILDDERISAFLDNPDGLGVGELRQHRLELCDQKERKVWA